MDFKEQNIYGVEIFLKNTKPNKKADLLKKVLNLQIFKSQKEILLL